MLNLDPDGGKQATFGRVVRYSSDTQATLSPLSELSAQGRCVVMTEEKTGTAAMGKRTRRSSEALLDPLTATLCLKVHSRVERLSRHLCACCCASPIMV